MNIFVGNMPYTMTDRDLSDAFTRFGEVTSARIITDRDSGRSRGFGFVEMPNAREARQAIDELSSMDVDGRTLKVNEAKPRNDRRY